jgi:hypothetical protein
MQSLHMINSYCLGGCAQKEIGDSDEKALYLQFCDTLQSLIMLVDHFGRMNPEIQSEHRETSNFGDVGRVWQEGSSNEAGSHDSGP